MRFLIIFLYFIIVEILYCQAITGNSICRKETSCRCRYNDGTGIDIKGINSILSVTLPDFSTVYFHPCGDTLSMPNPACINTSLCLKSNGTYHNIGTDTEANFLPPEPFETHNKLVYIHGDVTTYITLVCVENFPETHLSPLNTPSTNKTLNLALYGLASCIVDLPGDGVSTGSILVMLFLLSSVIYFVGGAAALFFLRGARGRELIPHVDFWIDLPYLVRDGVVFIQNGCKVIPAGATVYDQI